MRLAVLVMICLLCGSALAQQQPIPLAIVGLEHGHVAGFLKQFPNQHEVQLVGIVDADAELSHCYAQEFHLDPGLFYTQLDAMIAARHPKALLVYTSIGKHRQVIERHHNGSIGRQFGPSLVEATANIGDGTCIVVGQAIDND